MKSFNFSQFEKDLLDATRQVVQNLAKRKDAKDICAFALYSDESGSSISAAANSLKHLAKMQQEDPDEYIYFRWSPAEWNYDSLDSKRLNKLSDQLSSFSMELEEEAFEQYVTELFSRCLNVLVLLKEEGVFSDFPEGFILLFDVSDYDNTSNQVDWVKQLNSPKEAAEFENWLTAEGNYPVGT